MSPKKSESHSKQKPVKIEDAIIGRAYEQLKSKTKRYAKNKLPVLFVGETGTGKELFASYYFHSSPGNKKIFNTVNCAGFPETLLESEIFGHEKGAFTGATYQKIGKLEASNGGILFLDELGDASEKFQAAILRVLEYKSFFRVGGNKEIKVDVIIIAATNKPQALREDLKYRFHTLAVPPLQEKDIPILTEFFLKKPLKKEILNYLMAREFPGNVRELKRYCEKLEAEKGDVIFNKEKTQIIADNFFFDYDRYIQELETWNKYIQPIITRHKLLDFKYKYQDWDDNWTDINNTKDRDFSKLLPAERHALGRQWYDNTPNGDKEKSSHKMVDLIEWLRKGFDEEEEVPVSFGEPDISPKEILPKFRHNLRALTVSGTLPYLLKLLYLKDQSKETPPNIPSLTPLLDLPPAEASKEFQRVYLQYHLEKNLNDWSQAAKSLGITEKSLKQKFARLDKPTD